MCFHSINPVKHAFFQNAVKLVFEFHAGFLVDRENGPIFFRVNNEQRTDLLSVFGGCRL